MSAPAAKAFSLPVMTIAPIASSASKAASASRQFADQLLVQRIQRLRPVERDQADGTARLDDDRSR